jgi:CDP-diacylglycerol--serine O-phosphatidyltransferase
MDEAVEAPRSRFPRRRRRSGEPRRPRRGLYLIPHIITTAGIFFGFYAIVQSLTGNPDHAAVGILLAIVCDVLDGRMARLARSTSRFGMEYDSIADTISFGVAPAMLAFGAGNLHVLGRTGWGMPFLFTVCAALRLARFNVSPGRYRGRFEGLPSPAGAAVVATAQLFASFLREYGVTWSVPESLVASGMAVLGLLMVSPVPYRNFKEIDLRHSYRTLVVVVFAIALVVQEPSVSLFTLALIYVASGPIEWLWRLQTHRPLEEIPEPVAPETSEEELDRMTP